MALYEITFLTKEETDPGVRDAIEKAGGTITNESSLGRRRLAYPIKKETGAVYTSYVFDIDSRSVPTINARLRLNSGLLRYLIVTQPIERANKEVSKAVREAIEAADKLEDTAPEQKGEPVVDTTEVVKPVEVTTEPSIMAQEVMEAIKEEIAEEKAEETEEKPKKRVAKKPAADAAEATEEDRLKALEDKLGEILKD